MDNKQYTCIIFDVDGTLVETKSGATFRKGADDWRWLPGRVEKLRGLKVQGVRLAVATNQGGVAFGFMQREEILVELIKTCKEVGISPGGLYICYSHPKGSIEEYRREDDRRKPGPGMLLEAMRDFGAEPDETLFVGDMEDDEKAAKNAGVAFLHADVFFREVSR